MKKEGDPNRLTERQLLIKTAVDMQWVKKTLSNHLWHHEKYEIALIIGILLMVAERLFF